VDERSREDRVPGTTIAVVGPGAIGSTIAAFLHAAGHPLLLCGHTPRDSIEVRPDGEDPIVVPGPVLTDPADIAQPVDVVLLAVKDTQNEQAADWLARLCDQRTVVCALQNGVEQVERVGRFCPSSAVVPAGVWFSAEPDPQGWVRLTGRRSGMFRRDDVAALGRRYLAECLAVARAEGANLGDDVIDEMVDMFGHVAEDMTTSMLTDREADRPLEWDIRNGVIARKAAEHGLATPISDVVVPLLAAASDDPG
jgi:2-dehydropantoate 2-reductase